MLEPETEAPQEPTDSATAGDHPAVDHFVGTLPAQPDVHTTPASHPIELNLGKVESSGQRLAQFLKDQLHQRDLDRQELEQELMALQQELASKETEIEALREENSAINAQVDGSQVAAKEALSAMEDARAAAAAAMTENQSLRAELRAARGMVNINK